MTSGVKAPVQMSTRFLSRVASSRLSIDKLKEKEKVRRLTLTVGVGGDGERVTSSARGRHLDAVLIAPVAAARTLSAT